MPSEQKPQISAMGEPSSALVKAITRLLRPLVRALMAQGLTFPYLSNLLKTVYVDVANKDFRVGESPPTVSRLSVLTGLQRKDVKRILAEPPPDQAPPPSVSIAARLISIWTGDARFTDESGKPKPLLRTSSSLDEESFETLMRTISSDVRPKVILEEWTRLGVVTVSDKGVIALNEDAFVPSQGFDEKAYYLGRNVADHMAASVHNLMGGGDPMLERAVYYDRLTPDSIAHLRERSEYWGMKALLELNKEALQRADEDEGKANATERMSAGFYYFEGPDEKQQHAHPNSASQKDEQD